MFTRGGGFKTSLRQQFYILYTILLIIRSLWIQIGAMEELMAIIALTENAHILNAEDDVDLSMITVPHDEFFWGDKLIFT